MKIVLFCGGLGMRLREYSDKIPKPMVPIGNRPILWHLMKYYAHFGHKDFILCLGYRGEVIKDYFLKYNECLSNDFILSEGGANINLLGRDISDWKITFVDTGIDTNIAGRLVAVRDHLGGDEVFMANYADGLCDLSLNEYIGRFLRQQKVGSFISVKPTTYFHVISVRSDGTVEKVQELPNSGIRMNGGFFVFRKEIFSYIRDNEELVNEPFQRLIREQTLLAEEHNGFWLSMDTFKDKQVLDDLFTERKAPWMVWNGNRVDAVKFQSHHTQEVGERTNRGFSDNGDLDSRRDPAQKPSIDRWQS